MAGSTESHVEEAVLGWLSGPGYTVLHGPDISPDNGSPEQASYADVILFDRFRAALAQLNRICHQKPWRR